MASKDTEHTEAEAGGSAGVQSIEVGLEILSTLARLGGAQALSSIAKACGMPRAKAHRYLVSFERSGYVEREGLSGHYVLGRQALQVGLVALNQVNFVKFGAEILPGLTQKVQQSCILSVWSENGVFIVRWEDASTLITVNVRVGSLVPLLDSATGRVFGAYMPPEVVEPVIQAALEQPRPANAKIMTRDDAEAVFEEVRQRGISRAYDEPLHGLAALSCPVFDSQGKLAGAISSLGFVGVYDSSVDGPLAQALKGAAANLSERLGYSGHQTP